MKGKFLSGALPKSNTMDNSDLPPSDGVDSLPSRRNRAPKKNCFKKHIINLSNKDAIVVKKLAIFNNVTSGPVNSYLPIGTLLNLQKREGSFYLVKVCTDNSVGYISVSNVQIIEDGINIPFIEHISKGSIINSSPVVHIKEKAQMNSKVLLDLKNKTQINILGTQGQWVKVDYEGTIGYIFKTYIFKENKINDISSLSTNSKISRYRTKNENELLSNTPKNIGASSKNYKNPKKKHIVINLTAQNFIKSEINNSLFEVDDEEEEYILEKSDESVLSISDENTLKLANKPIRDVNEINIKSGESYFELNDLAKDFAVNSYRLDNLIYNHIFDDVASCRGYVSYSEIKKILTEGTDFQRKALIEKYGANCLVIKLLSKVGTKTKILTPPLFYKGKFYFAYSCANLYSLVNTANRKFKLSGVINILGHIPDADEFDKAVLNKEVYRLGQDIPTWTQDQINC